jgi:hypothetical protein
MPRAHKIAQRRLRLKLLDILANILRGALHHAEIGRVQLGLPRIQQRQRLLRIAYLIAQVVGDPAIHINVVEVLVQVPGQKPGNDREVLVMRVRQARAVLLSFFQRRSVLRDSVLRRQRLPPGRKLRLRKLHATIGWNGGHLRNFTGDILLVSRNYPSLAKGRLERSTF